ncbi:MAG: SMI1/KNR4 family protein [Solirubrobacteraceae bacterium MAG38_C4-C5]|nr:SMI1/KNR4 family protein [Candidatus Siliceabacter maunaloa]
MTPSFEEAAPPASEEQIVAAERELGVRLPAAYRAFLAEHNGGYLDPAHFDHEVLVERLFSAGPTQVEELEDLVSVRRTYSGPGSDHDLPAFLLPVAGDPFGNLVCLSVESDTGESIVHLWDHEVADPDAAHRSLGVAFDEFFERLELQDEPG